MNTKSFLLATTALCAFSSVANADVDILSILRNSPTKSDNITWSDEPVGTENIVNIAGKDYQYTVTPAEGWTYAEERISNPTANITKKIFKDFVFLGNTAQVEGGCIYNYGGNISELIVDFIENYASSEKDSYYVHGGVVFNVGSWNGSSYSGGIIENLKGNFIGNYAKSMHEKKYTYADAVGGAVWNGSTINSLFGSFIGNYAIADNSASDTGALAEGGAIVNSGTINKLTGDFISNYATATNTGLSYTTVSAKGGAIYNLGTISMVADANDKAYEDNIVFKYNYVQINNGEKQYEAIYSGNSQTCSGPSCWYVSSNLIFETKNGGSYTFYDYINGELYYDSSSDTYYGGIINFTSEDGTGTFNLYNDIKNQKDINFQAGYVLNMISPEDIHKDVFTSKYSYIQAQNITISAAIQMAVDVDLSAETPIMDHFEAENFAISGGSLNITEFKIVADLDGDIGAVSAPVALVTASVSATGLNLISGVAEAVSDVYAYSVEYNDDGTFTFTKTGLKPQPEPEPKVRPGRTGDTKKAGAAAGATQAVTSAVAGQTMSHGGTTVFNGINSGDEPLGLTAWVQAFGSNDDVELKHMSEKVDTQFYGLVGGIDSKRFTYDNGVNAVYGVFGAFVNGKQKLDDSKITNKSGYLGASVAFRKDIVFSNFTLTGGFIANEASSEFGKDKFDTKVVSVANKTGVDIQKGAWTITPSLLLSYTGIDTDDYTTKAGTKIDNDFMHVYTVAPELKVAKDFGEGFSGYAKVAYKMFFYDNEKIEADDVLMPAMSVKPYVEYGIGASKDWSKTEWNAHDIATYGEITRHDGGRTGWDLNLGLKLDF